MKVIRVLYYLCLSLLLILAAAYDFGENEQCSPEVCRLMTSALAFACGMFLTICFMTGISVPLSVAERYKWEADFWREACIRGEKHV